MFRIPLIVIVLAAMCAAQQPPSPTPEPGKPQVRVQMINPCTPPEADQKALAGALHAVPLHSPFGPDYEIDRGRTTLPQTASASDWVRIRKDFAQGAPFMNAQYSISVEGHGVQETLVLRPHDTKEFLEIRLEDTVTAAPAQSVVASDTPVDRLRVERSGKSSLTLGRCVDANQSAYEPLFQKASEIMEHYRGLLGVRRLVPGELARLGVGALKKAPATRSKKK